MDVDRREQNYCQTFLLTLLDPNQVHVFREGNYPPIEDLRISKGKSRGGTRDKWGIFIMHIQGYI